MRHPLLLAAAGLLAVGCAGAEGSPCDLDEQCAQGLACFTDTCQLLGQPDGEVRFEVLPPPAFGLGTATFPMDEQPLRFPVCAPSAVEGTLEQGRASVVIRGTAEGLDGREERWIERVGSPFRLQLPPGTWTLTFLEAEDDGAEVLPPEAVEVPPPPPAPVRVELARCETRELGHVEPPEEVSRARLRVVVDPERDPRPRCGVGVRVHDALTGEPLSQRLAVRQVQGQACAEPAEGWEIPFRAPAGEEIEVRIEPLAGSPATLAQRAVAFVLPDGPVVDLGAIGLAGGEAALERVRVEVIDPAGAPVEEARIRAAGIVAGTAGEWFESPRAWPVPGKPGSYDLFVLPGSYAVQVEPPPGVGPERTRPLAIGRCVVPANGGPCAEQLRVEPGVSLHVLAPLAPQLLLSGRAFGEERAPLLGARILALPLDGGRRSEARTGSGGRYELALDPGQYELLVQPREADAPWRRLLLPAPVADDGLQDLFLPPHARVVGYLAAQRGDGTVRVRGALVRAWRVDGEAPVLLGEALSDAQGRFALVLPAAP